MKKLVYLVLMVLLMVLAVSCGGGESTATSDVDVDMTMLSSTMAYSEAYNMTNNPGNYLGKTIKMNGTFTVYEDSKTKKKTYSCVVADASSCCAQGFEFVLKGENTYPDDYPEVGSEITVTGTFELYAENGFLYSRLKDATLS